MAALDSLGTTQQSEQYQRFSGLLLGLSLLLGTAFLWSRQWNSGVLLLVGAAIGWTLYRSSFGFASAYRNLIQKREVRPVFAQLLLIGLTTLVFAPLLAHGEFFGQTLRGAIAPIGLSGALGAFIFGIGMQLGGACGCGTLFSLGGGRLASLITLTTFGLGAFAATLNRPWFADWYSLSPIVLGESWGWLLAVAFQLAVLGAIAYFLKSVVGKSSPAKVETISLETAGPKWLQGPWSWTTGALLLVVLSVLVLLASGQPWRITWGFLLATAKVLSLVGVDISAIPFWASKGAQSSLEAGAWADSSFLTNTGMVVGAALAAIVAGAWKPVFDLPARAIVDHLLGGLLMGFGAFMAAGCNVNAFFGGLASTSLHNWVWIASALIGTVIGVRLHPLFQLEARK